MRVDFFFFISAVLLGSNLPLKYLLYWVLIVFLSVLVHELGHAMAFRAIGQQPSVVLTGFVGLTYGSAPIATRARRIGVSLAGPITQLAVLGLPAMALRDTTSPYSNFDRWWFLDRLVFVSIGWALFNLLPILPLDGGHVCEAMIGRHRSYYVSVGAAAAAVIWFQMNNYWIFLPLILGALNVVHLVQASKGRTDINVLPESPTGSPSGEDQPGGGPGHRSGPLSPPSQQSRPPRPSRRRSRLGSVPDPPADAVMLGFGAARPGERVGPEAEQVEALAWDALRRGDVESARRALARHPVPSAMDAFLLASVDIARGETSEGLAGFRRAYLREPNGPSSLVPAMLVAASGHASQLAESLLATPGDAGPHGAASLQAHLHYAKAYAAAAEVGELVHSDGRASRAQAAFETACSWAQAGNPGRGLEWLGRAVDDGFSASNLLDGEPDLGPLRVLPGFAAVRERLS